MRQFIAKSARRAAYISTGILFCIAIAAWFTPSWRPHIKNLLIRSWEALVSASSTSNFSVVYWTLATGVALWIVFIVDRWISLSRRESSPRLPGEKYNRFNEALRQSQLLMRAVRERGRDGLLGALVLLCLALIAYGYFVVSTIYADHQMLAVGVSQLMRTNFSQQQQITELTKENLKLRDSIPVEFAEPETSLRRRTVRLVKDLSEFWSRRPQPTQQPVQNPTTDEDRKRNAAWDQYWRDATTAYANADFRNRLVGIVREYKSKGVDTGYLEAAFEQHERLVGGFPFGGAQVDNCFQYMSEICQVRELAFHVDAHDQKIELPSDDRRE